MDDLQEVFKNNAVIVVLLVFSLMIGVWILVGVGIPFLEGSPQTFEAEEATSIRETDDKVFVQLNDPSKRDRTNVIADGNEVDWSVNDTVVLNKSEVGNVEIQAFVQGEPYSSYDYVVGQNPLNISRPSGTVFAGNSYTFTAGTSGDGTVEDAQWFVDSEPQSTSETSLNYEFNESKNYTVEVDAVVGGVRKSATIEVEAVEPSNVVLNASVSSTNVTTFEEITADVTEESNQSVEFVRWNFDDGTTQSNRINESVLHWYTEPGTYNINVSGESEEVEESGSDSVTVNVREPDEENTVYQLTVQAFEEGGPSIENASVSLANLKVKETDSNGTATFRVIPDEYSIKIEEGGYRTKTKLVNVQEDTVIQAELEKDVGSNNTTSDNSNSTEENETSDGVDLLGNNSTVTQNNVTVNVSNVSAPTALEEILNNTDGNGTGEDPYVISTAEQLQAMSAEPSANYALGNDIDASDTIGWNEVADPENETLGEAGSQEFETQYSPIVERSETIYVDGVEVNQTDYQINYFNGQIIFSSAPANVTNSSVTANVTVSYSLGQVYRGFDPIDTGGTDISIEGRGNTIQNLYINRPNENGVGLLENVDGAIVRDLSFDSIIANGGNETGALAARFTESRVRNIEINGLVTGTNQVGGVAGVSYSTEYDELSSRAVVRGKRNVGGVTGRAVETPGTGDQGSTVIEESSVESTSAGVVQGTRNVGGFAGYGGSVSINNSYANANVEGNRSVGGLVGRAQVGGVVKNGFSAVEVSSGTATGAVIGNNNGSQVSNFYLDTEKAGQVDAIGVATGDEDVTGLTTSEMQGDVAEDNMSGLNFTDIWSTTDGYPEVAGSGDSVYRVELNVTGSDGVNLSDAEVQLGPDRTKSGETIVFGEVPRGSYNLTVDSDGYIENTTEVFIDDDVVIDRELEVAEQFEVILSAVGPDGQGKENAMITLDGQSKTGSTSVYSSVDEGEYDVSVSVPAHIPVETNITLSNDTAEDGTVEASYTVREERYLEVSVLDNETGNPVETAVNGSLENSNFSATFEEETPVNITQVPEVSDGVNYTVSVNAGGYEQTTAQFSDSDLNRTQEIRVNRSETKSVLSVTVRDAFRGRTVNNMEILSVNEATDESERKTINTEEDNFVHFVLNHSNSYSMLAEGYKIEYTNNSTSLTISDNRVIDLNVISEETVTLQAVAESENLVLDNSSIGLSNDTFTDSLFATDGNAVFTEVPENESYEATANKRGYESTTQSLDTVSYEEGNAVNVTMVEEPEIIIDVSTEDGTDNDNKLEFYISESDVDATAVSGVKASDVLSGGDSNPDINLYNGVRYNFTGQGIRQDDEFRIDDDAAENQPLLNTGSGERAGRFKDDLDIGFIVGDGEHATFTTTSLLQDASKYRYLNDDGSVEGDLEANLVYHSSKP